MQRPIRVLRVLAWGEAVEQAFFAGKGRELPRPEYHVPANIAEIGGIQVLRIRNEGKRNKRVEIALTG